MFQRSAVLSVLALGATIWLSLTPTEHLDLSYIRGFVLMLGGLTGMVLFVMALGRGWAWRQEIWGGMSAWQGENAWRLWLVIYVQLFALALVFGSLSLARTDVRSNPSLRRLLCGGEALALLGRRGEITRHATLRAALEWSHALLSPDEQTMLRRLAVFAGSFSLHHTLCQHRSAPNRAERSVNWRPAIPP